MAKLFRSRVGAGWSTAIVLAVASVIQAQLAAQAAILQGRISDASGAVVPGARIVLVNEGTGVERTTQSDARGGYRFDLLPSGTYHLRIESPGLEGASLAGFVVEVGRTIVQDFRLGVGNFADTVTVVAGVPIIERSLAVGQIFDRATIEALPINGRQVLQFALLVPGAVTPPQSGVLTAPSRAQGSQAVNAMGHREGTANIQVNGVTLNDQINNILVFQPPIDAVQEFRIRHLVLAGREWAQQRRQPEHRHAVWHQPLAGRALRVLQARRARCPQRVRARETSLRAAPVRRFGRRSSGSQSHVRLRGI